MFSIATSLRLQVPIGRVWRLLVDVERYGEWHPTLRITDCPGDEKRVNYIYSPRGAHRPQVAGEGRITGLDWRKSFSWLGYPILRRACSVFLTRSNKALEQYFRRSTLRSRYARPSGRRA